MFAACFSWTEILIKSFEHVWWWVDALMRVHNFQNHLSILRNKVRSFANLFHALAGTAPPTNHRLPATQPPSYPISEARPSQSAAIHKFSRAERECSAFSDIDKWFPIPPPPKKFSRRKPKTTNGPTGRMGNAACKMHSWQQNCCCSLNRERRNSPAGIIAARHSRGPVTRAKKAEPEEIINKI